MLGKKALGGCIFMTKGVNSENNLLAMLSLKYFSLRDNKFIKKTEVTPLKKVQ